MSQRVEGWRLERVRGERWKERERESGEEEERERVEGGMPALPTLDEARRGGLRGVV